ncbi:hypothetical protein ARMSODRAFT_983202 [Armillaria solidipes]|uniref:C2H2-type domain-containing protein n=1 Tax=Armillaria solidipes TaxID=1076256 RepID=A0A2H3B884_9AGAR|nr:hypothetical protein ARMSODRAFT_983202 [Armillaria solidipes]
MFFKEIRMLVQSQLPGPVQNFFVPCEACERAFKSQASLDEHYCGSPNHPNCFVCGRGFKTQDLCDAHHDEAHPCVVCSICRITMYEHELLQHLKDSPRHPTCELCTDALGFESDAEFSLIQSYIQNTFCEGDPEKEVLSMSTTVSSSRYCQLAANNQRKTEVDPSVISPDFY